MSHLSLLRCASLAGVLSAGVTGCTTDLGTPSGSTNSGGLSTGMFGTLATFGSLITATSPTLADFSGDGLLDIVVGTQTDSSSSVLFGQGDILTTWRRPILLADSAESAIAVGIGADLIPGGVDRRGAPRAEGHITLHRAVDHRTSFAAAGVRPLGALPLTHAWNVLGAQRWTRVRGDPATGGNRLRIENRFGPRVDPSSEEDFERAGLSADGSAQQRAVVVNLPLLESTAALPTMNNVHVFQRVRRPRTASDYPEDPLFGSPEANRFLPKVIRQGESDFRDVFISSTQWQELPRDPDGDLSTDSSSRFVVDTDKNVLRVLLGEFGTIQAYVVP